MMKTRKRHLIILIGLITAMGWANAALAQNIIYFDLAAGDVTVIPNSDNTGYVYTGYVYQNNGASTYKVTGNHQNSNIYHVYQSSTISGSPGYYTGTGYSGAGGSGSVRVPSYDPVMSPDETQTWADYVTNNKHSEDIIALWSDIPHHPLTVVKRSPTEHTINIQAIPNAAVTYYEVTMVLDNVWCSKIVDEINEGPFMLMTNQSYNTNNHTLKLKGDNFFPKVIFDVRESSDPGFVQYPTSFTITSNDGDGSNSGSLTLTPNSPLPYAATHAGCPLASIQGGGAEQKNFRIKGGTIYAATPLYYRKEGPSGWGFSCIGAGNGTSIYMEISGGRVTAVAHSTSAAIGGGAGSSSVGGNGHVTISGGHVYAYQYGVASSQEWFELCTATAIGGGGSFRDAANLGDVTIKGDAYVYAESVGGVAIGGGSSHGFVGGGCVFNMTEGNPTVIAKSVEGDIIDPWGPDPENPTPVTTHVLPGTSIGGGNGGDETNYRGTITDTYADGGDADVDISCGTLQAGSIGGGKNGVSTTGVARNLGTADIDISGGSIQGQFIMAAGAATPPTFDMTGGTIDNTNLLPANGFYKIRENGGAVYMEDGTCSISGGTIKNATATKGGAVYMTAGTCTVSGTAAIEKCTASTQGGGVYMGGGSLTMQGGTIGGYDDSKGTSLGNKATSGDGGGIYVYNGGTATVNGGTIKCNEAPNGDGGGIYVNPGSGVTTNINSNTANTVISGNKAKNGGGAYIASGTLTVAATNSRTTVIDENEADAVSGSGGDGGGLYVASGTVNIQTGATLTGNIAENNGGGLYAGGGTVNVSASSATTQILKENEAANGGAIYANGGTVNFSNGTIKDNYATSKGGGLYIPDGGTLNLNGTATLTGNHVPANCLGGGVYLEGTVLAGNGSSSVITVADNYEGSPANLNNIYLYDPNDNVSGTPATHKGVISVSNDGLSLSSSRIGFSVPHNFVPVIYCATKTYLPTIKASSAVFEDSGRYSMYYVDDASSIYKPNFIYLSADTWVQQVTSNPGTGHYEVDGSGNITIKSERGLAWLISVVNGLNGQTPNAMSGKTVTLAADVDMKAHNWVPIGMDVTEAQRAFKGTFNGNGHSISNIFCSFLGDDATGTGLGLGLFGITDGATIRDVVINGMELQVANQTGTKTYVMGAITNEAKNNTNIYNCMASPLFQSSMANTIMGGLVGKLTSGNLKNSFANASFDAVAGTTYKGGLVGVNAGTVENCYSRVRGTVPASNFGYLVGTNSNGTTNGTLMYSYAPATPCVSGTAGTQYGVGTYGVTSLTNGKYGYKQSDQQITLDVAAQDDYVVNGSYSKANGLTGLHASLNKWVGGSATYSKWTRTMGSPINGDYPIIKYATAVCVGSTDNVSLKYSDDFNTLFSTYLSGNSGAGEGTVYLYNTPAALTPSGTDAQANVNVSNYGKATKLYIHEDVALKPVSSGSKAAGDIEAYVGVTLDNSAGPGGAHPSWGGTDEIDWHFFSSALTAAPIGLYYKDNAVYNYGVYPSWQAYFNDANGYFPTNLNTDTHVDGDHYVDWDLYAYYEPDYHWINYKRNSHSHWHEDGNYLGEHAWIDYTNDTRFEPGRGYMVALKEEGYLQAYGTLNTHPSPSSPLEVSLSYTPDISWTTRQGHNLLGNPYQSYLDFDLFADYNSGLWGGVASSAYYIIMDEVQGGYIRYAYGASANSYTAPKYLHPHQGFMVFVGERDLKAKFDDRMRNTTASGVTFRGDQPHYPLVNLIATDGNGNRDLVTVELGRPDKGGAPKQQALRTSTGSLWCRYEDEDYALVFTQPGLESASIRFATDEDGEYTMTWNTQNGEFGYLHLIDNKTGADIDCLQKTEYTFTSKTTDYASRFRLVFDYTGVEEPSVPEPVEGPTTFAYYANGEIHLVETFPETSQIQVIDLLGRVVVSHVGRIQCVPTSGMTPGVYILRLTTVNGTRTQKITIEK